jgi:hypothetical protein
MSVVAAALEAGVPVLVDEPEVVAEVPEAPEVAADEIVAEDAMLAEDVELLGWKIELTRLWTVLGAPVITEMMEVTIQKKS